MQQWEYKVLSSILISDENDFNKLGAEGWELVAVAIGSARYFYYFKRAVRPRSTV
jgi:hypothetical protein